MTIQEARALKPGELSSDRDYYRTGDGVLIKNLHTHAFGDCSKCPLLRPNSLGGVCSGELVGCGPGFGQHSDSWKLVPSYMDKPSKEWSFEDWKEAAEAGAYVTGFCCGKPTTGKLALVPVRSFTTPVFFVALATDHPYSSEPYGDFPRRETDGTYRWDITGLMSPGIFATGQVTFDNDFVVIDAPNTLSNPGASVSGAGVSQTKPGEGTSPTQERDINMSNLTKSEKAAASNPNVQAFGALSLSVQLILHKAFEQDPSALQYLNEVGQWKRCTNATFGANKIYRVHPDAETAPEQRELALRANGQGDYVVQGYDRFAGMGLFAIAANKNTIGIVYEKYGCRTTKTSLNLEFGTPVAVIVKG